MADMTGQVALVTGGIRGIGLAICKRLTNRGITVAAGYAGRHDHAQQFAGKYADHGVSIHQGNIGSNDDSVRVIGEVLDRHGQLDILVNNAASQPTTRSARWPRRIRTTSSTSTCPARSTCPRSSCSTCSTAATAASSTSPRPSARLTSTAAAAPSAAHPPADSDPCAPARLRHTHATSDAHGQLWGSAAYGL
jgi:NAD(P)-dependent dehydrogenase (short-subunit alcohol dehydrogenase family)